MIIDDFFLMGRGGEFFCFFFNNKNELWIFFLEKVYMKVMGGYDFLGFNFVSICIVFCVILLIFMVIILVLNEEC